MGDHLRFLQLFWYCYLRVLLSQCSSPSGEVGNPPPPDPPGLTTITAIDFAYSPELIKTGGDVTLRLRNEGAVYHDLRIEGIDDFSLEALPDEDDTGSVKLESGSYVLFCSVPGHQDAGMIGELLVS